MGSLPEQGALHAARAIEFQDVKGVVEQVLARFQARTVYFDRFAAEAGLTPEWLHPYRAARVVVDGVTVGWFGQLHPREAAARKLKEPVLVGEIYLDRLYKLPLREPVAREISRFQPVRRDFSLVLDESIAWEKIDQAMAGLRIPELVEWRVREVFHDASWARASTRCCWARRFRRRTARCARRSCRSSRREWWRLLAKLGRGCEDRRKSGADLRYTRSGKLHLHGGYRCRSRCGSRRLWTKRSQKSAGRAAERQNMLLKARGAAYGKTLSVDDFSALEERILRTVNLVKRERQARIAAEERARRGGGAGWQTWHR